MRTSAPLQLARSLHSRGVRAYAGLLEGSAIGPPRPPAVTVVLQVAKGPLTVSGRECLLTLSVEEAYKLGAELRQAAAEAQDARELAEYKQRRREAGRAITARRRDGEAS